MPSNTSYRCLCGFVPTKPGHQQTHRKVCPVWKARDKKAVTKGRRQALLVATGKNVWPPCLSCGGSMGRHKRRCLAQDRLLKKQGIHPLVFKPVLRALAKKLAAKWAHLQDDPRS